MEQEQPQKTEMILTTLDKETKAISGIKDVPKASQPIPLAADDRGLLIGSSLEDQFRLATAYCRSGLVPKAFDTPEKVLLGMQYARELGLQPVTALRQIAIVSSTPHIWGDLPLSLVMRSGKIELIQEAFFAKDNVEVKESSNVYGAVCRVTRVGLSGEVVRTFTLDDAKKAGLLGKDPWIKYPRRMLQCRARAWALKDLFPDVLNGVGILEYDQGIIPSDDDLGSSINTKRSSLNDKFAPDPVINHLTGNNDHENKNENFKEQQEQK